MLTKWESNIFSHTHRIKKSALLKEKTNLSADDAEFTLRQFINPSGSKPNLASVWPQ
jgi:hypothetical protein